MPITRGRAALNPKRKRLYDSTDNLPLNQLARLAEHEESTSDQENNVSEENEKDDSRQEEEEEESDSDSESEREEEDPQDIASVPKPLHPVDLMGEAFDDDTKTSPAQRKILLASYKKALKKYDDRMIYLKLKKREQNFVPNKNLRPRLIETVRTEIQQIRQGVPSPDGLQVGKVVADTQLLLLAISEYGNVLGKVPRFKAKENDTAGKRATRSRKTICCRARIQDDPFCIKAHAVNGGWKISCLEFGEETSIAVNSPSKKCSFKPEQLYPIVRDSMSSNPKMSAIQIKTLLKPFVREIMISKATINAIRRFHRNETYGDKCTNVMYLEELADQLQSFGHKAKVLTCDISEMKEMSKKVAQSSHNILESTKENANNRLPFAWSDEDDRRLDKQLGTNEDIKFVTGFLFISSVAIQLAGELLDVFACDGAHVDWDSFTLYSLYGLSSDRHTFNIGHALLFGNEDTEGWKTFLSFAKGHVAIDLDGKTMFCDQQKGLRAGIAYSMDELKAFCCYSHRLKNVQQSAGGTKGREMFEKAVYAMTESRLIKAKNEYKSLQPRHQNYLNKLADSEQYPAARARDAKLYGYKASSFVESMNKANLEARGNKLDLSTAVVKLLQLEQKRFHNHKDAANQRTNPLTQSGFEQLEENHLGAANWNATFLTPLRAEVTYSGGGQYAKKFNVTLKEADFADPQNIQVGELFSLDGCDCGYPRVYCFPCKHMIAAAEKKHCIASTVCPPWFHTATLQRQYPVDVMFQVPAVSDILDEKPNQFLRLATNAPRKTGRPKKASRIKGALETAGRNKVRKPKRCKMCSREMGRFCPCREPNGNQLENNQNTANS